MSFGNQALYTDSEKASAFNHIFGSVFGAKTTPLSTKNTNGHEICLDDVDLLLDTIETLLNRSENSSSIESLIHFDF